MALTLKRLRFLRFGCMGLLLAATVATTFFPQTVGLIQSIALVMLILFTRWLFRPTLSVSVAIALALLGSGALVRIAAFPAAIVISDDLIAFAILVAVLVVIE